MIRRRSDIEKVREPCTHHETFSHELSNYNIHVSRQHMDPEHDDSPCWCCCTNCMDLVWHHPARKGVWWAPSPDGKRLSPPEIYDASPGSAETSTS